MQIPDKNFTFEGDTYPLDSPLPRVGSQMINKRFDELLTKYSTIDSEVSQYGSETFGEIGFTQFVAFSTDSSEALINFVRDNHELEPISDSISIGGYGSVNRMRFCKPQELVKTEVEELKRVAEEDVRATTERFKLALADAKQTAKEAYIAYQEHLKSEDQQREEQQRKEEEYFRSLV